MLKNKLAQKSTLVQKDIDETLHDLQQELLKSQSLINRLDIYTDKRGDKLTIEETEFLNEFSLTDAKLAHDKYKYRGATGHYTSQEDSIVDDALKGIR